MSKDATYLTWFEIKTNGSASGFVYRKQVVRVLNSTSRQMVSISFTVFLVLAVVISQIFSKIELTKVPRMVK